MLLRPSKNITLVVYQDQQSTKSFEVNKTALKTFLLIVPVILTIGPIIIYFLYSYIKHQNTEIEVISDKTVQELRLENAQLAQQFNELNTTNKELTQKLGMSSLGTTADVAPTAKIFGDLVGGKSLVASKLITIEQAKIDTSAGLVKLSFALKNETGQSKKLSGHIFVLMTLEKQNALYFYPNNNNQITETAPLLGLENGESFLFSRLRLVDATFNTGRANLTGKNAHFLILIFSNSGDLMVRKTIVQKI